MLSILLSFVLSSNQHVIDTVHFVTEVCWLACLIACWLFVWLPLLLFSCCYSCYLINCTTSVSLYVSYRVCNQNSYSRREKLFSIEFSCRDCGKYGEGPESVE